MENTTYFCHEYTFDGVVFTTSRTVFYMSIIYDATVKIKNVQKYDENKTTQYIFFRKRKILTFSIK